MFTIPGVLNSPPTAVQLNSRQVQLLPSAEIPRQALVILQEALLCHPGAREAAGKIPGSPNRSNIWKQNVRKNPCLNNLCSGFSARTDIFFGVSFLHLQWFAFLVEKVFVLDMGMPTKWFQWRMWTLFSAGGACRRLTKGVWERFSCCAHEEDGNIPLKCVHR